MTARKIIDEAISAFNTYRHPHLDDARKLISDILKAAGKGTIEHDKIETLDEYTGFLRIETSWSTRGCEQTSEFEIPSSIIDADDPIVAATRWGLNEQLAEAQRHLASHNASADLYKRRINDIMGQLDTL